jgi:hypothetical protein
MLCGLAMAGCNLRYTTPIAPAASLTPDQKNFDALWLATQDVLRHYNFQIDRQDRRAGVITTKPLLAQEWFEVWRHDGVGPYNYWEGSFQTIYRTAEIHITPTAPGAGTFAIAVQVQTGRADRLTREITNTSDAYNLFVMPGGQLDTSLLTDIAADPLARAELARGVVPLGPDELLTGKLSAEINASAAGRLAQGNFQP